MPGARVVIEVADEEVLAVIQEFQARLKDPAPAFAEIGEYGVTTTRERIESQNAEDPIAFWEPLSMRYLKSKRKREHHPDETLVLYGFLLSTLVWQADTSMAEWGTPRIYGPAQQFGRPEINLPARPFLGVTERNRTAVLAIFRRWLAGA